MPTRSAKSQWEGGLKNGTGRMSLASGAFEGSFSFETRMGDQAGTNPEELIAAAHSGCFSMALSAMLEQAGHTPKQVATTARVTLEQKDGGFAITRILLECQADVPGIDDGRFQEVAQQAKTGCPVSKALAGTEIELVASLGD